MSCFIGGLKRIRGIDRFGFTPALRFNTEGYKEVSIRGLFGSFVLLAIFIAYVVITLVRFFTEDPSISLIDSPTSQALVDFPPFGITFRRNVDGRPLTHFYNESYFRVRFDDVLVREQDLYPRETRSLGSQECDFTEWAGWSGNRTLCPAAATRIGGRYQSPFYNFLVVHIVTCDPSAPYYKKHSDDDAAPLEAVQCAPQSEIDAVLSDGRFNMVINFPTLDGKGQFESDWFLYNPTTRTSYEGIYHTLKVVTTADLLTSFGSTTVNLLRPSSQRVLSSAPIVAAPSSSSNPSSSGGGGRIVLSIYARMDSMDMLETRSKETSLDVIGSWAALYGAIFGVLAIYFGRVNEEKFYRNYAQWDNVGLNGVGGIVGGDVAVDTDGTKTFAAPLLTEGGGRGDDGIIKKGKGGGGGSSTPSVIMTEMEPC